MKKLLRLTSFALVILPSLALAEGTEPKPTDSPLSDGFGLLRDGAELLMKDLFAELEPALKGFEAFALELDAYEPPVMLPNGDILIRRKAPKDEGTPADPVPQPPRDPIEIDPMPDDDIEI